MTALGTDPNLVLELIDFFNGGDGFRYNEESDSIRRGFGGRRLERIYLLCTKDTRVKQTLDQVQGVLENEYPAVEIEAVPLPFADLCSHADDEQLKEIVYRLVSLKVEAGERLVISSSGRKTVTNRLIEAGLMYGCEGYLSITADISRREGIRFRTESFNVLWIPARQFNEEKRANLKEIQEGIGNNFRSLYLLPSAVIGRLRRELVGAGGGNNAADFKWLRQLPKADLHCHLGGAFSADLLRELADMLIEDLQVDTDKHVTLIEEQLGYSIENLSSKKLRGAAPEKNHCLQVLKEIFKKTGLPHHCLTAALVSRLSAERILDLSYDGTEVSEIRGKMLEWYICCGDLGGSALLQSGRTLRRALNWLLESARQDGCVYVEIRCSPDNYVQGGLTIREVMETLFDEASRFMARHHEIRVNFLIMATRHKAVSAMVAHVSAAILYAQVGEESKADRHPRVVGFDLAGQEENHDPALYTDIFLPLHHHFINITIHAGEMEQDDKIWQALYLLHAKRIGHGLKLVNNERMMGYVRDYGIGIELCPSSNIQTNSFCLYGEGETEGEQYPLKRYLDKGINATVNTDNLGISQTTLSRELLLAGQLTEGGLSRWEILQLCKNALKAVFLPKDEKDQLLKEADKAVFELVLNEYFPSY